MKLTSAQTPDSSPHSASAAAPSSARQPAHARTHWGDLILSADHPAIIAPLATPASFLADGAAPTHKQIDELIAAWHAGEIDAIEWRIDSLYAGQSPSDHHTSHALSTLRDAGQLLDKLIPPQLPVLATVRSAEEAQTPISQAHATPLLHTVMDGVCARVRAIDIEWSHPQRPALLTAAAQAGLPVVASAHFFAQAPPRGHLAELWREMAHAARDLHTRSHTHRGLSLIGKLAIMPENRAQVDELLSAARTASGSEEIPLIAIAMGELGQSSRIDGPRFGSCASFATVGPASAPGQLPAGELARKWCERGWRSPATH